MLRPPIFVLQRILILLFLFIRPPLLYIASRKTLKELGAFRPDSKRYQSYSNCKIVFLSYQIEFDRKSGSGITAARPGKLTFYGLKGLLFFTVKNIQPLSDDYIKFIRFAEHFIEKNGSGIVAMITNNSFLDGIIHH